MAEDQHDLLEDSELHEAKGFSTAANQTVLTKNASGDREWVDQTTVGGQGPQGEAGTTLQAITVADVNDPVELNSLSGVTQKDTIVCVEFRGTNNKIAQYNWDTSTTTPEAPPISVDGDGGMWVLSAASWTHNLMFLANGYIRERQDVSISSDGAIVILALERVGGGDLTYIENGKEIFLDTAPALTIALTAGSDTSPTTNYTYLSSGTITNNTTGFPTTQHVPLATTTIQSAASVQADGVYSLHAWSNNYINGDNMGELSHITRWVRNQNATWIDGVDLTPDVGVSTFDIATSSGNVLQLHPHAYPAFDTGASSYVYVVNDFTTAYKKVSDLITILTDSLGNTMSNRRFNLVIWGVVSEDSGDCNIFINLPSGNYGNDSDAITDSDATADYSIPASFKGSGFLISRLTVRHVNGSSTWSILQNEDLRGLTPSTAAGSGSTAVTTSFPDNNFEIFNVSDNTKKVVTDVSAIDTATTRTTTYPNKDVDLTNVLDTASYNAAKGIAKSVLAALAIDMSGDKFKTKAITGNSTFTITNPTLGAVVQIEVDGDFTITLPSTVRNKSVEDSYDGSSSKKNLLSIECIDSAIPVYWATIMVGD